MLPVFRYGEITQTTAASESLFKEVKVDGFQHEKLPMRADTFVEKHLNVIMGATVLTGADYRQDESDREDNPDDAVEQTEYAEEDWRGLMSQEKSNQKRRSEESKENQEVLKLQEIEPAKEPSSETVTQISKPKQTEIKKNYLLPDPGIRFQNLNKSKCPSIRLMKNGNQAVAEIAIDGQNFPFSNTCALDSLIQVLFVAYTDSSQYSDFVNGCKSQLMLFDLISDGVRAGTAHLYKKKGTCFKRFVS